MGLKFSSRESDFRSTRRNHVAIRTLRTWSFSHKAESAASGHTDRSSPSQNEIVELIPAMRAFARTFYRDINDADDLVQITLVRALGSLHQFNPGTSMKSWLFTIMRNAFYTCVSAWNKDPVSGVIGIQKGPL